MGIGHKQESLFKVNSRHHLASGGELRRERAGRGRRALSTKEPLLLTFKVHQSKLRRGTLRAGQSFLLINKIVKRYSGRFFVSIDQWTIQNDHIHLLVRAPRRSIFHHFHRVVAGQIAQNFEKAGLIRVTGTPKISQKGTGLWKFRPHSRVVRGFRAYKIALDYIRLNELEVLGKIPYRRKRLRGLSSEEWELLKG